MSEHSTKETDAANTPGPELTTQSPPPQIIVINGIAYRHVPPINMPLNPSNLPDGHTYTLPPDWSKPPSTIHGGNAKGGDFRADANGIYIGGGFAQGGTVPEDINQILKNLKVGVTVAGSVAHGAAWSVNPTT
ncbi:hypothetical protein Hte_009470 [Hypoxylon texense]